MLFPFESSCPSVGQSVDLSLSVVSGVIEVLSLMKISLCLAMFLPLTSLIPTSNQHNFTGILLTEEADEISVYITLDHILDRVSFRIQGISLFDCVPFLLTVLIVFKNIRYEYWQKSFIDTYFNSILIFEHGIIKN